MLKIASTKVAILKVLETSSKIIDSANEMAKTLPKVKKSKNLAQSKKLAKLKKWDFVKTNSFKIDFFTPKAKKTFTHL